MKTYIPIILLVFAITLARAQVNIWTDPIPVTDSISDNANPSFNPFHMQITSADIIYMVWEKFIDDSTTAIYCRSIFPPGEPFPLLMQSNVQFKNPQIGMYGYGDTVLYVLYETNLAGNWDISYVKFLNDGTISSPVAVCDSIVDERNFDFYQGFGLVWETDGKIRFWDYNLPGLPASSNAPITLDEGSCHYPTISPYCCAWEKYSLNDTSVFFREFDPWTNQWEVEVLLSDTGLNIGIFNKDVFYDQDIVWQQKDGPFWRLKGYDYYFSQYLSFNDFPGCNNETPVFVHYPVILETSYCFAPNFFGFSSDYTGNYEIYINEESYDTSYFNISDHPGIDTRPHFCAKAIGNGSIRTILVWESFRNGHWQLWMSYIDVVDGIGQMERNSMLPRSFPNPFSQKTTISYKLGTASHVSIEICDLSGTIVRSLENSLQVFGNHSVNWDGRDDKGNLLPGGIYIGQVNIDGRSYPVKLVKF